MCGSARGPASAPPAARRGLRALPAPPWIRGGFPLAKAAGQLTFRAMEDSQLVQYLPVLMLGVLAVLFSFGMLVGSVLLGKKGKRPPIKDTAYECGMLPVGPEHEHR